MAIVEFSGIRVMACGPGFAPATAVCAISRKPPLPEHLPAWAISVHKSQGSEFDRVLLLLPDEPAAEVLTRELLYTAITRARHEFGLLALPEVLRHTVGRLTRRHSGLAVRLGWPEMGPGSGAPPPA